jgi:peptidoglycan/LPS O-acetylase OafA/YrhL
MTSAVYPATSHKPSSPTTFCRLPSLDGWRAVSIGLVLAEHSKYTVGFPPAWKTAAKWLVDGGLGVRFFFVISGFLITWLMICEHDRTGQVNLKHFYARRALRILPVYYAFIIVLIGLQTFTQYVQPSTTWIGNLTFTTNFLPLHWTSGHLWSLSTEEQFYLIWPGLFLICGFAANMRRAAFVLAIPILLAPLIRVSTYLKAYPSILTPIFSEPSFFFNFDSLAVGCASAILLSRNREAIQRQLQSRPIAVALLAITLILTPHILTRLFLAGIITVPLGYSMQAVGFALLLLQSVFLPEWGLYRALNWPWVCRLGVLSYSIYIWQQIFCSDPATFGFTKVWWMSFPGWLVPSIAVASISYYGLEKPLLRLRARFREI